MRSRAKKNQRHSSNDSVMQVQRSSTAGAAMQDATLGSGKAKAAARSLIFYYHDYRKCIVSAVLRRSQLPPAVRRSRRRAQRILSRGYPPSLLSSQPRR